LHWLRHAPLCSKNSALSCIELTAPVICWLSCWHAEEELDVLQHSWGSSALRRLGLPPLTSRVQAAANATDIGQGNSTSSPSTNISSTAISSTVWDQALLQQKLRLLRGSLTSWRDNSRPASQALSLSLFDQKMQLSGAIQWAMMYSADRVMAMRTLLQPSLCTQTVTL
jgi:hypothetical protein